jgi:hypothetical protein
MEGAEGDGGESTCVGGGAAGLLLLHEAASVAAPVGLKTDFRADEGSARPVACLEGGCRGGGRGAPRVEGGRGRPGDVVEGTWSAEDPPVLTASSRMFRTSASYSQMFSYLINTCSLSN